MKKLMPLLVVLLVVFLGYWMFQEPTRFAEVTKTSVTKGWELLTGLFNGLIDFFDALFA